MYSAELHGKIPSKIERAEDILTSNVFSFFKYSRRNVFLKGYLNLLGYVISDQDAENAEFIFWPRFEDNTEPDLVVIAGDYYFLFEAKYFSDFSSETPKTKHQLLREIQGGKYESKNSGKIFVLIAITRDHYYKKEKFKIIPYDSISHFKWTNWQAVSSFLNNLINTNTFLNMQERLFATDLYNLLDKKNLRDYQGIINIFDGSNLSIKQHERVFFKASTAKYRGDFIGFTFSLSYNQKIEPMTSGIFFKSSISKKYFHKGKNESFFNSLREIGIINYKSAHIYFKGGHDG